MSQQAVSAIIPNSAAGKFIEGINLEAYKF
jgi:hypothetical protein